MNKKPLILVTNDDGVTAPGIKALVEVMLKLGDVVVVAPDSPQSGMGHAITLNNALHLDDLTQENDTHKTFSCSGTPADCVKIAINEVLDRRPDLVVSGINHGSNASINVIYSGTMSAAVEAGIEGINAIGFSLLNYNWDANFESSKPFIKKVASQVLEHGLPKDVVLNVNIPDLEDTKIKGIKVSRQARANWKEKFDKRQTPQGRDYYWLTGVFENYDNGNDTDEAALEEGYISVVPISFDLTAHHAIQQLNNWKLND